MDWRWQWSPQYHDKGKTVLCSSEVHLYKYSKHKDIDLGGIEYELMIDKAKYWKDGWTNIFEIESNKRSAIIFQVPPVYIHYDKQVKYMT